MTGIIIRRPCKDTVRDIGGNPCEDGHRSEWCVYKPRNPRKASTHLKLEREKKGIFPSCSEGVELCWWFLDSDFGPPELWECTYVVLSAPPPPGVRYFVIAALENWYMHFVPPTFLTSESKMCLEIEDILRWLSARHIHNPPRCQHWTWQSGVGYYDEILRGQFLKLWERKYVWKVGENVNVTSSEHPQCWSHN